MKHISFALFIFFLLSVAPIAHTKTNELGPAIGSNLPHELAASDQNNIRQSFKSLTGNKGLVLVFYRSADWCPFCQMQLIDLNQHALEKARAMGFEMVGISYDLVPELAKFSRKWKVDFPLLSDEGSTIIDAFGLRNDENYKPGDRGWGVPHPVMIITDNNGQIHAKLYRENYRKRPEPAVLLETLEGLDF